MKQSHERDTVSRTDGSGRFDALPDLDRPTRVRIETTGPLARMEALSTVSETWTLVSGKHDSNGNGIMLKLHGMMADVLVLPAHPKIAAAESLTIEANVTKMVGCPLGGETPWPVNRHTVEARLYEAAGTFQSRSTGRCRKTQPVGRRCRSARSRDL
jgi:hypothetical protein